jgi:hypothetical protein
VTCREARARLADLWDAGPAARDLGELRRHLSACPACARESEVFRFVLDALAPPPAPRASRDLARRVIRRIAAAGAISRGCNRRRLVWAAAAPVALFLPYLVSLAAREGRPRGLAAAVLEQSAEATGAARAVRIPARLRARPDAPPLPLEIRRGDGGWPSTLLDTAGVLRRELRAIRSGAVESSARFEGGRWIVVLAYPSGAPASDWIADARLAGRPHRRIYVFSAGTLRLESLRIVQPGAAGGAPFFETAGVEYETPE